MGRAFLGFALHHIDAGANLFIDQVQTALAAQYGCELCLVFQVAPISVASRICARLRAY